MTLKAFLFFAALAMKRLIGWSLWEYDNAFGSVDGGRSKRRVPWKRQEYQLYQGLFDL